jgi:hypothetical protein
MKQLRSLLLGSLTNRGSVEIPVLTRTNRGHRLETVSGTVLSTCLI